MVHPAWEGRDCKCQLTATATLLSLCTPLSTLLLLHSHRHHPHRFPLDVILVFKNPHKKHIKASFQTAVERITNKRAAQIRNLILPPYKDKTTRYLHMAGTEHCSQAISKWSEQQSNPWSKIMQVRLKCELCLAKSGKKNQNNPNFCKSAHFMYCLFKKFE